MKSFKCFIFENEIENIFSSILKDHLNGNIQLYQEKQLPDGINNVYVEFSYVYNEIPYKIILKTDELDISQLYKNTSLKNNKFSLVSCNDISQSEILDKNNQFSSEQIINKINDFIKNYKKKYE